MKALQVLALVLTLSIPQMVLAESREEILEKSPTLLIMLDNSGSSPASNQTVVNGAWSRIEDKIRSMPLATEVVFFTVGDATAPYFSKSLRIQKRSTERGGKVDEIVEQGKKMVVGFPELIQSGKVPAHGKSDLIGGFFDASKRLNKNAEKNSIIFISDLVENSNLSKCYEVKTCKLPKPEFSLEGTDILVIGVGFGLPSDLEINISNGWEKFLTESGASSIKLTKQ